MVITPDFESGNPSSNLGGTLIFFCYKLSDIDVMSEWLRRWTWNPLGYARAGSNPAVVVCLYSVMDIISVYGTDDPGSIPGRDLAAIAQLAEHALSKRKAVGSNPTGG